MGEYVLKLDYSQWPLLVATYEGEIPTSEYQTHLDAMIAGSQERRSPFVLIVDSDVRGFGPVHRKISVEHMVRHERFLKEYQRGVALVLRSALQRGFMTAISWVYSTPYVLKTFATLDEASLWGRVTLGRAHGPHQDQTC